MTIPVARDYSNGSGVHPPNNLYFINDTQEDIVELSVEQDPIMILSAQLHNNLYITSENEFVTNVPEIVFKDFISRGNQWKTYINQGGWKNLSRPLRMIGKMVASSIMQEYFLLGRVGQETRCMFGLEKIALYLRDVISMETFFSSLV